MQKISLKLVALILVFSLNACGQTGPLYLPEQKPPIYVPHHPAKAVF